MVNRDELAALLDTIADATPRLRDAGVRGRVKVGELEFEVGPGEVEDTTTTKQAVDEGDPLDDPTTYGLPPGSPIPGRKART